MGYHFSDCLRLEVTDRPRPSFVAVGGLMLVGVRLTQLRGVFLDLDAEVNDLVKIASRPCCEFGVNHTRICKDRVGNESSN